MISLNCDINRTLKCNRSTLYNTLIIQLNFIKKFCQLNEQFIQFHICVMPIDQFFNENNITKKLTCTTFDGMKVRRSASISNFFKSLFRGYERKDLIFGWLIVLSIVIYNFVLNSEIFEWIQWLMWQSIFMSSEK